MNGRRLRIAVLASGRWAPFKGSMHYLSDALSELGHDVLYVDPPVSPLSLIRHPERRSELFGPAIEETVGGPRIWRPRVLPGQNSGGGQALNAVLLRKGVHRHLGTPDLVLASSLEARGALRRLDRPSVYVCIDSFEDLPHVQAKAVRAREATLLQHVSFAAACSEPLRRQLAGRGVDAVTLPHGVAREFLADGGAAARVPDDLAQLPRPRLGYVGSLNFRIDSRLLRAALDAIEGGSLVLVGGWNPTAGPAHDRQAEELLADARVHAIGHRPTPALPGYLAGLDVGLVPYRCMEFNRKSYPLKIPQYLAAGLPVVSTPNGATDHLGDLLGVASDPSSFAHAVQAAVADRETGRRRSFAAKRPWTSVATELLDAASQRGLVP